MIRAPHHQPVPSGSFVGEGAPISAGALIIGGVTLGPKKICSLVAVTRELLAGSVSNTETTLRTLLGEDLGLAIDHPARCGGSGCRPS